MKADQDTRKTTLGNGIKILTKKMPHIRSVTMGVWVDVGARDESLKENGLSHLIEHLIFKGTEKRSAKPPGWRMNQNEVADAKSVLKCDSRYSSRRRPSIRIGTTFLSATAPTIPHI